MKETLAKLQYDLVVFPVDKPTFNVTFICNRSYDNTLFKEFGVIGTPKKTCKLICDYNKSILLNSTVNEIKQHLSMSTTEKMRVFPTPSWIPKIHKPTIGTRSTIASKQGVIKPLSKSIAATSKLLYKSVEKYYIKSNFYFGFNLFWMIQNNKFKKKKKKKKYNLNKRSN